MTYRDYLNEKPRFDLVTWIALICGIYVVGGVFGYLYETGFYLINNGVLTRRGKAYGPWILIYGIGSLLILLSTWRMRKKPWAVFLTSGLVCGVLEFATGWCLYHFLNGYRGWDYNVEIWNWGNIGGYVCLRSVGFFAASGVLLMYVIIPLLIRLLEKIGIKTFLWVFGILAFLFAADELYNNVLCKIIGSEDAITFYARSGWWPRVDP